MKQNVINQIDKNKLIVIIRGLTDEQLLPTVSALYEGGVRLVEITFDQSGKFSNEHIGNQIKLISEKFADKLMVGAGTVMTCEQVDVARKSGALYIISPNADEEVIRHSVKCGLVSIPGVLTATEAANAHKWGADYIKLFPAGDIGMSYIKSLAAPLNHLKMLAVGGVNENNIADFLSIGICGVGVGSNIVKKEYIKNGEYDKITELAKKYTEVI